MRYQTAGHRLAAAVGMALAEKRLAEEFNRNEHKIVDHYTYVFAGDGALTEEIAQQACVQAAALELNKLIVFCDTGDDDDDAFSRTLIGRFQGYGWRVIGAVDGHDTEVLRQAIGTARSGNLQPTLICCQSTTAADTPAKAHRNMRSPAAEIYHAFDARARGQQLEGRWIAGFAAYRRHHPELAGEFKRRQRGHLPPNRHLIAEYLPANTVPDRAAAVVGKAIMHGLTLHGGFIPYHFSRSSQ